VNSRRVLRLLILNIKTNMNKQISTGVGITAVIIVAIIVGVVIWFSQVFSQNKTPIQNVSTSNLNSMQGKIQNQAQNRIASNKEIVSQVSNNSSMPDLSKIQFDVCGKKDKYNKLAWWSNFMQQVGKIDYVSPNHVETALRDVNGNESENPNKIHYDSLDLFCKEKRYAYYDVCSTDLNRKITSSDFDEGEGCLSKDGSLFIAVFPGMYMDGGNHVFRYSIKNNLLEEAKKINEKPGEAWFDPPFEFRKRIGNIVKMYGSNGDAGCGMESDYEYDFVKNEVKVIKTCRSCQEERAQCETFR
jgi:hypothetical protein